MLNQRLLSRVIKCEREDKQCNHTKMPLKGNAVLHYQPRRAGREITDAEKGTIIAFFNLYEKILVVAALVKRPWSVVPNFLAQAWD